MTERARIDGLGCVAFACLIFWLALAYARIQAPPEAYPTQVGEPIGRMLP